MTTERPTPSVSVVAALAARIGPRFGPALRWIAGTRASVLARVDGDVPRYTALGALLVGTALIATASMWFALDEVTDAPWSLVPVLLIPALCWGGFILVVDRALITGVTTSPVRRTSTLLVRLAMAAALGTVVAEPVILQVFGSAIEERIETDRAAEVDALRTGLLRCNPVPDLTGRAAAPASGCDGLLLAVAVPGAADAGRVAQLQSDAAALQASLDADAARQRQLVDHARDECGGATGPGLSGVEGYGRLCTDAKADAAADAAAHPVQPRQGRLDDLRRQATDLLGPAAASAEGFTARRDALIDDRVRQLVAARPSIGLLERLGGLDALTSNRPGLEFREWFLRLFLIVIDCLPVLVKFIGGVTAYDRAAEEELGRQRDTSSRRSKADRAVALGRIEAAEQKELDRIDAERRRHDADRAAEEDQQIAARTERLTRMFVEGPTRSRSGHPTRRPTEGDALMDEALIQTLAMLAVKPMVQAMGTSAWSVIRDRWAAVFGRNRAGGEPEAAAELEESAGRVTSGRASVGDVRDEWHRRLEALLRERPDLTMEVRALVDDVEPPTAPAPARQDIRQRADVGHGISVQSGGNTTIGRDLGSSGPSVNGSEP